MENNGINLADFPELEGLDVTAFGSTEEGASVNTEPTIQSSDAVITNAAIAAEANPVIQLVEPSPVAQQAQQPQGVDNSRQLLTDVFGEDLDTTAAKERLRTLKEENERLTALATGTSQGNTMNERAARFNSFVTETGSEDYGLFQQLESVTSQSDPIDILLLEKRLSSKGAWTPQLEQALKDRYVERYKQDSDIYSDSEVALGKYELQDALASSIEKIDSIKSKMEAAKPVNVLEIYNQSKQAWQPHIEQIKARPETSQVNMNFTGMGDQKFKVGNKEIDVPVVYDIPKSHVEELTKEAWEIAARNGLQYDEKTSQGIIEYVQNRAIQYNFKEIVSKAIQVAIERVNEVRDQQVHNPSALAPEFTASNANTTTQQGEEDISDIIMRMEGLG